MTVLTFTPPWSPSPGSSDTPEVSVLKADFGDGYTQTSAQLNNVRRVLALKWDVLSQTDASTITDFLKSRSGTEGFYYRFTGDPTTTTTTASKALPAGQWTSLGSNPVTLTLGSSVIAYVDTAGTPSGSGTTITGGTVSLTPTNTVWLFSGSAQSITVATTTPNTPTLWTCETYATTYAAADLRGVTATLRQSFVVV